MIADSDQIQVRILSALAFYGTPAEYKTSLC
jgi:hypothetical protein